MEIMGGVTPSADDSHVGLEDKGLIFSRDIEI